MTAPAYLIFCKERSVDGVAVWWRPHWRGYTSDVLEAGRYIEHQARQIYLESRGDDFPVPLELVGTELLVFAAHVPTDLNREKLAELEQKARSDYAAARDRI